MKTKTINLYRYDELSDKAKGKAINNLYDINVDHDWWSFIYKDAERISLKITSFDLDRNRYAKGDFMESAEETAYKILKEHSDSCETYKTAKDYLEERDTLVENCPKDENGEFEDQYMLDQDLDFLDSEFLKSLLEDYSIMLQKEYEWFTIAEQIEEMIIVNQYYFDENGNLE